MRGLLGAGVGARVSDPETEGLVQVNENMSWWLPKQQVDEMTKHLVFAIITSLSVSKL